MSQDIEIKGYIACPSPDPKAPLVELKHNRSDIVNFEPHYSDSKFNPLNGCSSPSKIPDDYQISLENNNHER